MATGPLNLVGLFLTLNSDYAHQKNSLIDYYDWDKFNDPRTAIDHPWTGWFDMTGEKYDVDFQSFKFTF